MRPEKKKLVILGGGIGSLVTAWHLTSQPNWKEIYESITVYQTGWRLGGKCASGRGPNGRIEEHGLHIWFGFYDNSFDVIQNAYAMLGRPAGSPLATWPDAFKKHSYLVIAHQFKVNWHPWEFDFPVNDRVPGRGSPIPNLWQYISLTIDFIDFLFLRPDGRGNPASIRDRRARAGAENRKANLRQVVDERQQEVVAKECRSRDGRLRLEFCGRYLPSRKY